MTITTLSSFLFVWHNLSVIFISRVYENKITISTTKKMHLSRPIVDNVAPVVVMVHGQVKSGRLIDYDK